MSAGLASAARRQQAATGKGGLAAVLRAGISERTRLWSLGLLIVAAFVFGGGSRGDIASLIVLRPLSFVLLALGLIGLGWRDWARLGMPGWIALGVAALAIMQLVPLPPAIWSALPGRELPAEIAAMMGWSEQWRPLSLSPSRTLNAGFALGVPLASLALLAGLRGAQHRAIVWLMLGMGALSSIVGLAQLIGPPGGPLYFYRITNPDVAVGLFANRNHHAIFLASVIPLLGYCGFSSWHDSASSRRAVTMVGIVGTIAFLVPLVLATGSRAGALLALGLSVAMIVLVGLQIRWRGSVVWHRAAVPQWLRKLIAPLMLAGIAGIAGLTHFAARSLSFERLLDPNMDAGLRAELLPHLIAMARDHFPAGTGLGAFRQAWEVVEPRELLRPQYLNQAHNDVLQLVIEGGAAGLALMIVVAIWFVRSGARAWSGFATAAKGGAAPGMALFAWLALAALLAGSVFDYPLRTPSLMAFAALLACLTQISLKPAQDPAPAERKPSR